MQLLRLLLQQQLLLLLLQLLQLLLLELLLCLLQLLLLQLLLGLLQQLLGLLQLQGRLFHPGRVLAIVVHAVTRVRVRRINVSERDRVGRQGRRSMREGGGR